ncbi:sugar phosphate isomerase/epimerase family protein [Streptomyces sp. NPDC000405]|uniref:sugar phosphate isomerase/epimerase family protein n=1 Tax=Streptomyces sp. NPDC000405 TaxID=3161033 RepID=UPI00398D1A7A
MTAGIPAADPAGPLIGLADWRLPVTGPAAVDLAARLGADGLQLDLGGPGRGPRLDVPDRLGALRERSAATGVRLLAVTGNCLNDIGITAPAGSVAAHNVRDILERVLDTAHALEAPLAFVPSFRRSAIDGLDALRRTAEVLAWAAGEAAARGLLLASENTLDPEKALALVEHVESPAFRLLLDTYNPRAAGVDVPGLVRTTGHHFADQIHLKDGSGPGGTGGDVLLGDGDGGLPSVLAVLAAHRVRVRALVLETDHRADDPARLAEDLARARAHARTVNRTVAPTITPPLRPSDEDTR